MTLEAAIRAGDLAAATGLVRTGVDVNCFTPEGLTPLMIASGLGHTQMVDLPLTAGAQVLAVEPRAGAMALHKAALSGNPDVVALLLDHGAFIDQQSPILGHTALMDAVVYKHDAIVRVLLTRGARTAIRNHWHETALDIARRDGLDTIARLIEARDKADDDEVRAQTLVPAIKAGDLEEVERLIAAGAAVNERLPMVGSPDDDYTPLAIAAREGHAAIVLALLEAGANPRRVIGLFRGTALHEACYFGHVALPSGDDPSLSSFRSRLRAPSIGSSPRPALLTMPGASQAEDLPEFSCVAAETPVIHVLSGIASLALMSGLALAAGFTALSRYNVADA